MGRRGAMPGSGSLKALCLRKSLPFAQLSGLVLKAVLPESKGSAPPIAVHLPLQLNMIARGCSD